MRIWVTRPAGQADTLLPMLGRKGAQVLHLPMMAIEPLPVDDAIRARLLELDQYDLAFFISANAATIGMDCVGSFWPQYPAHLKNYTPGPTTAAVLEQYGLKAAFPARKHSSEGILELPGLDDDIAAVRGKQPRALIFRGVGGREKLAEGLLGKGLEVDYLELYRRRAPQYSREYLLECVKECEPDIVIVTSGEALENFTALFEPVFPGLRSVKLLVSSPRLHELAREAGFDRVTEMPGADDASIIASLEDEHE